MRNPYKAIVSYWNLLQSGSQTGFARNESFNTSEFEEFLYSGALRWFEVIEDWIIFGKDVHFIFYENVLKNPPEEMRKLMNYLGLPVDEDRLSCLAKDFIGQFYRKKQQQAVPFKFDHHQLVRLMIERADKLIRQHAGVALPQEEYEEYRELISC